MKHAAILSVVAFLLHFAWENVQCPLFFVHGTYEATWRGMTTATLGAGVAVSTAMLSRVVSIAVDLLGATVSATIARTAPAVAGAAVDDRADAVAPDRYAAP